MKPNSIAENGIMDLFNKLYTGSQGVKLRLTTSKNSNSQLIIVTTKCLYKQKYYPQL